MFKKIILAAALATATISAQSEDSTKTNILKEPKKEFFLDTKTEFMSSQIEKGFAISKTPVWDNKIRAEIYGISAYANGLYSFQNRSIKKLGGGLEYSLNLPLNAIFSTGIHYSKFSDVPGPEKSIDVSASLEFDWKATPGVEYYQDILNNRKYAFLFIKAVEKIGENGLMGMSVGVAYNNKYWKEGAKLSNFESNIFLSVPVFSNFSIGAEMKNTLSDTYHSYTTFLSSMNYSF